MATSRTCPLCRRWHETTMACRVEGITDGSRTGAVQRAADLAETAAILRYLGLTPGL